MMKCYTLVNPGLEKLAQQEIKELLGTKVSSAGFVVEFDVKDKEELLHLAFRVQSVRRLLLSLGKCKDLDNLDKIDFSLLDIAWKDFFPSTFSCKAEVENVKGQDNRIEIAKKVTTSLFKFLKQKKITATIEYKKPDFWLVVHNTGKGYVVGIDVVGIELNKRHYRVFAHHASFKGDFAYYFVRSTGLKRAKQFKQGEKLLVGFMKDGGLAIEAALFLNELPVLDTKGKYSFQNFQMYKNFDYDTFLTKGFPKRENKNDSNKEKGIMAFDSNRQNVTAARKNAAIAGVMDFVEMQKYALDELDVRYGKSVFDRAVFHITRKDEDAINELYYQLNHVLKPGGTVLLIGRENWEFPVSEKFRFLKKEEIRKGDSVHAVWVLRKK